METPEFDLVIAFEPRPVIQVIREVLWQTVGHPDEASPTGRREWAALSFRHFESRGILSHNAAKEALDYAVAKGYLLRRECGKRRWPTWEYAVRYRQVDNVPHKTHS